MARLHFIFYILLFILPLRICAQQQNYVFQHITTKDGLASDVTRFIFQDSKGFYWLGYDNGFQKFDSKNFITTSFRNEYVRAAPLVPPIEDKAGNIFVYNQGSIYVYEPAGKVDTIRVYDNADDRLSDIYSFCKDEFDDVWFVSEKGLYKYDEDNHTCVLWLPITPRKTGVSLTTILYDSHKKSIWLARDKHVFLVDLNSKKITEPFFSNHPGKTDLPETMYFVGVWMDSRQNLWISSWNGSVYKYNTITYKKEMFDAFNNGRNKNQADRTIPYSFLEDKQKHIWIGCLNGGLYYYDESTNFIHPVSANNNILNSLHYDDWITALYEDKEGNIWVGTDKGISIFNPSVQQFNNVDENSLTNPLPKTEIIKIFQTSTGDILMGTWGKGWFMYNKDLQLKKHFYDSAKASVNNDEYRKNLVWCFAEDHNGKIWIGYQYGLIGIFNPVNQATQYMDVPEFDKKTITAMQCDAKGNIWFGLHSGFLGKWDVEQHRFLVYKNELQLSGHEGAINDILSDKEGKIWIATWGSGFCCFDPMTEKIAERYFDKEENCMFDNVVNSLTRINDSIIGISTKYKGVIVFNRKKSTASSLTIKDGLPVNNISGLATDKLNNFWIATDNGLLRINAQHKLVSFDEEDGLLEKKFVANITKLNDGRMAIPTATGFVYFSPDKINNLPAPPEVTITSFAIYDKPISTDSALAKNKTLNLNHTQNFITIGYASVSFLGRNTTQYYYQLEGINKDWVSAGTQRFAGYTNLSPGHYTFKVKCESRDGIHSENVTEIAIYISPPWWLTWWAYTLYVSLAGAFVYGVYRNRIQQLERKQAAQLNVMVATQEAERKRISRDLHDDVGTKLSALKLFLSSLRDKAINTNNEEIKLLAASAEQFITEAMKDVRQLLLNLSPAVLEEFGYTTAVEGLINKINETKQIHFSLVLFGMKQRLPKEVELALYRITQELINNVLKHAAAKNVSLQIGRRDKKIILMIEDDGKGFDVNTHNDGYGLHNLEARTKLMLGMMTIDSQPGKGTSVLIEIPDNFNGI